MQRDQSGCYVGPHILCAGHVKRNIEIGSSRSKTIDFKTTHVSRLASNQGVLCRCEAQICILGKTLDV
ncbi:hypothetical protein AALO_G00165470 [Alosa alosa]|uniref:Uncharacterized protein n=1 Tax=Alosa alosa TaxID=278164 RepID=A0AAV6GEJ6_9TELE|nr:hypothetical protein AALO_G00165470 [Alosa alosa]